MLKLSPLKKGHKEHVGVYSFYHNHLFNTVLFEFTDTSVGVRSSNGSDLLSVLLNKGNKLREEMIISALDSKAKNGETGHATQAKQLDMPIEVDDPNISLRLVDG